jgi:hypothetical protein
MCSELSNQPQPRNTSPQPRSGPRPNAASTYPQSMAAGFGRGGTDAPPETVQVHLLDHVGLLLVLARVEVVPVRLVHLLLRVLDHLDVFPLVVPVLIGIAPAVRVRRRRRRAHGLAGTIGGADFTAKRQSFLAEHGTPTAPRGTACVCGGGGCQSRRCTGTGGDNGIDHNKNTLRFPYASEFWRSHYLHPHP